MALAAVNALLRVLFFRKALARLSSITVMPSYDMFVKAGGDLAGQAQAISLGVARALLKVSQNHRIPLKREELLTRDSGIAERKKVGPKKARKTPQFSKR
ncbi:30S ribosomal protein [Salix suchowensis]|nr:30S ribosomal protein [Salix suchowensis]